MAQSVQMLPVTQANAMLASSGARDFGPIPGGKRYKTSAGVWIQYLPQPGGLVKMIFTSCGC